MLGLFRRHFFTAFGTIIHRFSLLGLLDEQFTNDQLGDSIDFLNGLFFDRQQIRIREILDPATFDEPLNDEVSNFLGCGYDRCRFHGNFLK